MDNIYDTQYAPMSDHYKHDMYRKIQVITDTDLLESIVKQVIPDRFMVIRRVDLDEKPYRPHRFNIVISVISGEKSIVITVHKNSLRELEAFDVENVAVARDKVQEICRHRIETLTDMYVALEADDTDELPDTPYYNARGQWVKPNSFS